MILLRHVARMVGATVGYGVASRRLALVLLVVAGIALVGLIAVTHVVAPIVVYPFV